MGIKENLERQLQKRIEIGNIRSLTIAGDLIDFNSNDYLGLAQNSELQKLIEARFKEIDGIKNGATGSRLLSGNNAYCELLESDLAAVFKGSGALVFNSGYMANQAVLSCIIQKGDTILYDEKIHACIKEGARLSFARYYSFRHNNLQDLTNKLSLAKGNKFVVIESIYSMDGDEAPIEEILKICEANQAQLIVDEAHSTGVVGVNGQGLICSKALEKRIFIRIYTFGKAMGVHGACVVSDQVVKDYLINYARPFIYTTALPLHSLVSIRCAFDFLKNHAYLQDMLKQNIAYFIEKFSQICRKLSPTITRLPGTGAIQALIIPGNDAVKSLADYLQDKGFDIRPIMAPTVMPGQERIRICLHAFNTKSQINALIKCINQFSS